ncbi:MAG: aminotransferase class I/II-fold pyridoxal phosphate-dependent enzyme [Alphaproteobacteria bacterium]
MRQQLQIRLAAVRSQHRWRRAEAVAGIDFISNDYLGLATHPLLLEFIQHYDDRRIGAGASRLLGGHHPAHQQVEEKSADFFGREAALFFANGYMANLALLSTLPQKNDIIFYDSLIHASLRDGMRLSMAKSFKAGHNSPQEFQRLCEQYKGGGQIFMVVESLYGMDGDLSPLPEMVALAKKYRAFLVVDEAHATGLLGATGKGLSETFAHEECLITIHTGGKAMGVAGAVVCAIAEVVEWLKQSARAFIYATAPLPLQAALFSSALNILEQEPNRRELLHQRVMAANTLWQDAWPSLDKHPLSPIFPLIIGQDEAALNAATWLQQQGIAVKAIRPPTVPLNTARLRLPILLNQPADAVEKMAIYLQEMKQKI